MIVKKEHKEVTENEEPNGRTDVIIICLTYDLNVCMLLHSHGQNYSNINLMTSGQSFPREVFWCSWGATESLSYYKFNVVTPIWSKGYFNWAIWRIDECSTGDSLLINNREMAPKNANFEGPVLYLPIYNGETCIRKTCQICIFSGLAKNGREGSKRIVHALAQRYTKIQVFIF